MEALHSHDEATCISCGLDHDFDFPPELAQICHRGDLVVFAGAGISTEVPAVFPETIYEEVSSELDGAEGSFPELMARFEERNGRSALVKKIKKKFDYVDSFPRPRRSARKFHRELATIPFIRDIITTNWDMYFEEECLATQFVQGDDVALLDLYDRRVFKLHGSISNLSSLVVTENDYSESIEALGGNVLGAHVNRLLSTKTIIFVGYSLNDWNFGRIYETLRKDMGKFAPKAYFVSPYGSNRAEELGLVSIRTSGTKFVRELKRRLGTHCVIPDEKYEEIERLQAYVRAADAIAKEVPFTKFPSVVYCWNYHDGVMDACFRILQRRGSGEYSSRQHVRNLLETYDSGADRAYSRGHYSDCAYMTGYSDAMLLLLTTEEDQMLETMPFFFLYAGETDLRTTEDFRSDLERSRRKAPKERAVARRMVANLPEGMVLEHNGVLSDLLE